MMNYSKRSDGRRLLLVIVLFGILSTYGISTANVAVTDGASTEESSEPAAATTTDDQSTDGGLTPTAAGAETASEAEKGTETSVGETTTQPGGSPPGGISDEQTGNTVGGSSITRGEGTVETATSDKESSTAEGVSSVRTGGGDAGVESSAGGTDSGTTATVREAQSAGATGTEKQTTEDETKATVTGATSTDEVDGPLGAAAATVEESATSVKQTSKAADAQYTTNMGDTSAERQAETTAPIRVTVATGCSTLAPIGCNSTSTCETPETLQINNRLSFNLSICGAEAGVSNTFQYCVTIELHDQSNPSAPRTYTKGSPHKVNGSTVLDPIKETISAINNRIRSRTTTTPPGPPAERKRRQADDDLEWNYADIIELWETAKIVVDNVTCASGENSSPALESSPALPSSPQSTETLAESSTASGTTSVWDAHRAGCNSTNTCETCETLKASKGRLSFNASICKAETAVCKTFQYVVTIELHDQRNPSAPRIETTGSPHEVNCSTVLGPIKEIISTINNRSRSRSTTTRPLTTPPVPPSERKRRQANGDLERNGAGCRSTGTCDTCETISANRGRWLISGSICEAENGYCVSIAIQDQRNPSFSRTDTYGNPHKVNCSTVLDPIREKIRTINNRIRSRPTITSPRPSTTTTSPIPPAQRKRRQADNDDDAEWDDADINAFWKAATNVVRNLTSASGENSSPALTSSPLTPSAKDDSTKADDPKAVKEPTQTPGQDVWSAHRGIFVTVAILISVCVVVTAFCCLCMKWRERGGSRNPEKHPIAMEEAREVPTAVSNPITDREMIQDEAPMQERENPAVTPNGGGQHISKADEDNGWVVPLDELSNAEKEKPEVENTRL